MRDRPVSGLLFMFFLFFAMFLGGTAAAVTQYKDEAAESQAYQTRRVVKTVEGLNFEVEEDRPIVQVNGLYRPVDLDAYVAIKFSELDRKLEETTGRLQDQVDQLTERVRELESLARAPAGEAPVAAEPAPEK